MSRYPPLEERFWAKVDKSGECWLWTATTRNSYGYLRSTPGRTQVAHRISYELLVGPIPDGLQLDHLCRNKLCVNPAHLEPVTQRENILRGNGGAARNARKTHCAKGHPFDVFSGTDRRCRQCTRERLNEWKRRKAVLSQPFPEKWTER